jgi:hypothetical protein
MTARLARTVSSAALVLLTAACTNYYEIPIETPIRPKLDVSAFQRVLVAGSSPAAPTTSTRISRRRDSCAVQLRTKSELRVIDTDVLPLMEVANESNSQSSGGSAASGSGSTQSQIKDEKDLEPFERVFANVEYWKKVGEEYQQPLIVTGTVMFTPHQRNSIVQREEEVYDSFGRRRVVPVRTYMERKGYILRPKFVFIDGRSGTVMHSENFREEILYNANQTTPALSSYFELMDRLIPSFLSTLSSQKIKGTRILLQ